KRLMTAAANLATAASAIHAKGYVIGDVNHGNMLVHDQAVAALIDTDSFQVTSVDEVFYSPVATVEFTPPELFGCSLEQTNRTMHQDAFGIAILIFQLLMQGSHPFLNGRYTGGGDPPSPDQAMRAGYWPYGSRRGSYDPPRFAPPWEVL